MSQSLCWSCSNCSPRLCAWVMASGRGDVPAYVTAHEAKTLSFDTCANGTSTRIKRDVRVITECERHSPGRLDAAEQG